MNKACTFLMVCLFVSLGGGCTLGEGCSCDNLSRLSAISVYPDRKHLTEVKYPHYYSNISLECASAVLAPNQPYQWEGAQFI